MFTPWSEIKYLATKALSCHLTSSQTKQIPKVNRTYKSVRNDKGFWDTKFFCLPPPRYTNENIQCTLYVYITIVLVLSDSSPWFFLYQFPNFYCNCVLSLLSYSVSRTIANCLLKLPKNDFTRKMIDFETFTKSCLIMWDIWAN